MSAYQHINSGDWGIGLENRIASGIAEGYTQEEVKFAQKYIDYIYPKSQRGQGKTPDEAKQLLGFDTGGYTGEWDGSYGKLAVLH
jgi:hypothetical protein